MTMQRTKLADIQYIAATASPIYTNPASTKTYINEFELHNTNTTPETVKLYNVPDSGGAAGTAGTGNRFLNITLAANETFLVSYRSPKTLTDAGDSIQAETTTASKVTIQIHGDKDS